MAQAVLDVGPVWTSLRSDEKQRAAVQELLTLVDPNAEHSYLYKAGRWDGTVKLMNRADNSFLAGLTLRVARFLVEKGFEKPLIKWPAVVAVEPLGEPLDMEWRDYQMNTVERAILMRRAVISCPTGGGKTEIGIELARRLGRPVLWLTHRKELLKQTAARFKQRGLDDVGIIGAGQKSLGTITIATIMSLIGKEGKQGRELKLDRGIFRSFGVVIADEAHHAGAETWQAVLELCDGAEYRFGLTATPDTGSQITNMKIEGALGPIYKVATTMQLASEGFVAKPEIVMLTVAPTSYPSYESIRDLVCPSWRSNPRQLMRLGNQMFRKMYDLGVIDNEARNKKILDIAMKHVLAGDKFAVLVARVNHAQGLTAMIQRRLPDYPVWGLDGSCKDEQRQFTLDSFKIHDGGALLIATPFFREGVDVPQIDAGMLAGGGEAEISVLQGLGRMLRYRDDKAKATVYDFLDGRRGLNDKREDKDWLQLHSSTRVNTYKSQGFPLRREA